MQTVSSKFDYAQKSPVRLPVAQFKAAFAKQVNAATSFFTIGVSSIGGSDIIAGTNDVLQLWDKYQYFDYSNRIIDVSYDRSDALDPNVPVVMAQMDITLDNHDNIFTPSNQKSPLYPNILPRRPVRLYLGFDNEVIPIFVGVTSGLPTIDETAKTAAFHCYDFIYSITGTPLDNDILLTNVTEDVAIGQVLQSFGLSAMQYKLDAGSTILPFVYFAKGTIAGDALKQLVQTGLGRLYMDEQGIITYESRTNWLLNHNISVFNFNKGNCLDVTVPTETNVINVVEITANARSVAGDQMLWKQSGSAVEILPNSTVTVGADFSDNNGVLPVTSVDTPQNLGVVNVSEASTSYYTMNTAADGSGNNITTGYTLSVQLFSTSYLMTFTNNTGNSINITDMELWGTPAPVTNPIYIRVEDTNSSSQYDEQILQINNDYIQSETQASSLGGIITGDNSQPFNQRTLVVLGIPPLQVGDLVYYADESTSATYSVIGITGVLSTSKGLQQTVDIVARTLKSYFRIGISSIGGTDQLSP